MSRRPWLKDPSVYRAQTLLSVKDLNLLDEIADETGKSYSMILREGLRLVYVKYREERERERKKNEM